ncbi:MAG TPA: chloride channel protein, partial [Pseudolabrys sp.]|nr:chloride channel protein [Pseudolabrys sp.]
MRWFTRPLEVPHRLRAIVRARESSVIVLALIVGAFAGLAVAAMGGAVGFMHEVFFGLDPGERLSGRVALDPVRAFLVPSIGGLLFGLVSAFVARRRGTEVDPIEANALHGGRMSMRGSMIVAAQTMWSSGIGASVGLEAGYTQFASGVASAIGRSFRLRRSDMRVLVGCGAAAAIAGAFGAPLGGAFYGFELIIGSYSIASLAPVGMASLVGYLTAQVFTPDRLGIETGAVTNLAVHDVVISAFVGALAAVCGVILMRGVAACELLFTRMRIKPALRPMIGGALVGLLALLSPQVMSSGHGALHLTGIFKLPIATIALIFVLKSIASMISLGSGFRGGLFFASLLLGALGGQLFALGLGAVLPGLHIDPDSYAIIGMCALSVSVIGGPLTMTFIALETTGDLWLTT